MPDGKRCGPSLIAKQEEAERAGFEPAVRFDPHTAFPVPHNRTLCHLSIMFKSFICSSLRHKSSAKDLAVSWFAKRLDGIWEGCRCLQRTLQRDCSRQTSG